MTSHILNFKLRLFIPEFLACTFRDFPSICFAFVKCFPELAEVIKSFDYEANVLAEINGSSPSVVEDKKNQYVSYYIWKVTITHEI